MRADAHSPDGVHRLGIGQAPSRAHRLVVIIRMGMHIRSLREGQTRRETGRKEKRAVVTQLQSSIG